MAYTVKQVAAMSGVSVRTLHFYDETALLKPARVGANGYRFYEEAQLLTLQQILFYRELGFELKRIGRIIGRQGFEEIAAPPIAPPGFGAKPRPHPPADRDHRPNPRAFERNPPHEKRRPLRRLHRRRR